MNFGIISFLFFALLSPKSPDAFGLFPCLRNREPPVPQCITHNAKQVSYCGRNVVKYIAEEMPNLHDKKLITISPGGLKGFYMLGVAAYIKAHYTLSPDKYIFSGSSAGAWIALFMSYKGDGAHIFKILHTFVRELNRDFRRGSFRTMLINLRALILENFRDEDFALENVFIGITHLDFFMPKTTIYTGFESLRDAVDCCTASSHIPFFTGGAVARYRGLRAFDGGFSKYPYLSLVEPVLEITPGVWSRGGEAAAKTAPIPRVSLNIHDYTTMFSKHMYDLVELFELGFLETFENDIYLRKSLE